MMAPIRDMTRTFHIRNLLMKCILAIVPIAFISASQARAGEADSSRTYTGPDSTVSSQASVDDVQSPREVDLSSGVTSTDTFTPDTTLAPVQDDPGHELSLVFRTEPGMDSSTFELAEDDSLPPPVKPRLLPENTSFMERGLWGESGILRDLGIASPLTPEVRKHELDVRRTMLTMHQIGGFVTLGSMLATVYFGQKYLDRGQRGDLDMHETFVATTIASYSATALLAVLSPPPLIRREGEISTTTIHKTLAWIHAAGMIVTPLLGAAIHRRGASYYDQARYHQIAAYITTAVFAASMIIITF
jgi:hypothetical protein